MYKKKSIDRCDFCDILPSVGVYAYTAIALHVTKPIGTIMTHLDSSSPKRYEKPPSALESYHGNSHLWEIAGIKKNLGRCLRDLRTEKKISTTRLAGMLDVDIGEIFRAEVGDPLVSIDFLLLAMITLGLSTEEISQRARERRLATD